MCVLETRHAIHIFSVNKVSDMFFLRFSAQLQQEESHHGEHFKMSSETDAVKIAQNTNKFMLAGF